MAKMQIRIRILVLLLFGAAWWAGVNAIVDNWPPYAPPQELYAVTGRRWLVIRDARLAEQYLSRARAERRAAEAGGVVHRLHWVLMLEKPPIYLKPLKRPLTRDELSDPPDFQPRVYFRAE